MSDADTPLPSSVSYCINPANNQFYAVDEDALVHDDIVESVPIEYGTFQYLAVNGQLSGERLAQNAHPPPAENDVFDPKQVLGVRLKQRGKNADGPPQYAWASRFYTRITSGQLPNLTQDVLVGDEVLWLWPPAVARNIYLQRKEMLRLNPTLEQYPMDSIEPSLLHVSFPGAMLGPHDIQGARPVNIQDLSQMLRFLMLNIRLQKTLFPRRVQQQSNATANQIVDMVNKTQMEARLGKKWRLHNDVKRKREHHERLLGLSRKCQMLKHPAYDEDDSESVMIDQKLDQIVQDKMQQQKKQRMIHQGARWADLPQELLVHILCMALTNAIVTPGVEHVRDTVNSMRAVSKGACQLVNSYIGIQLDSLVCDVASITLGTGDALSTQCAVATSRRVHAMGVSVADVLKLPNHCLKTVYVPGWTLPRVPKCTPDWRWWLELRRVYYRTTCRSLCQDDTTTIASIKPFQVDNYKQIVATMQKSMPHIAASWHDAAPSKQAMDEALDIKDMLLTLAGI